jgi:hypothetical protein
VHYCPKPARSRCNQLVLALLNVSNDVRLAFEIKMPERGRRFRDNLFNTYAHIQRESA